MRLRQVAHRLVDLVDRVRVPELRDRRLLRRPHRAGCAAVRVQLGELRRRISGCRAAAAGRDGTDPGDRKRERTLECDPGRLRGLQRRQRWEDPDARRQRPLPVRRRDHRVAPVVLPQRDDVVRRGLTDRDTCILACGRQTGQIGRVRRPERRRLRGEVVDESRVGRSSHGRVRRRAIDRHRRDEVVVGDVAAFDLRDRVVTDDCT